MADQMLTVAEVAKLLRISEKTAYNLAESGGLPGRKVGGQWRFRPQDFSHWIGHEVLTLPEVAKLLRVSEKTAYNLADNGTIPGRKVGGQWRFRRWDLEQEGWAQNAFVDEGMLSQWARAIQDKGNAILYGPPGTAKTCLAVQLARHMSREGGFWELFQAWPWFQHDEDYIQGVRSGGTPAFHLASFFEKEELHQFCDKARVQSGTCVLVIDEMDCGDDPSSVCRELVHRFDDRASLAPVCGRDQIRIPANVRIIGTMNTVDWFAAPIDDVLRRWFVVGLVIPHIRWS